jgi:hypothetical protein
VSAETTTVDSERADDLPFDLSSVIFDQADERTPVSTETREDLPFENLGGNEVTSLADHLSEQLRLATDDPDTLSIGMAIIGNLAENGYLRADGGEVAAGTGRPGTSGGNPAVGFDPRGARRAASGVPVPAHCHPDPTRCSSRSSSLRRARPR